MTDVGGGRYGDVGNVGSGGHVVGHAGIGLECPVSCLGVGTVGDLVRVLAEAGRAVGLHAMAGVAGVVVHEHERVTPACPIECLGLSGRALGALRTELGPTGVVGDVVLLLRSGELADVRGIGPRRAGEIRTALIAEGFPVQPGGW